MLIDLSPGGRKPTYEELEAENARLRRRVAELEATVADLRQQIEALRRAGKRQAAPFSRGQPKAHPRRPGRQPGHAASHRPVPPKVDCIQDVPLPASRCPDCGGPVEELEVQSQYQTDIPPVQPVTTRFDIHIGQCVECGRRVQGRHPDQTSDALGAAAVQVGPNALALACEMKHRLGLSYGKLHTFFTSVFDFPISRATFVRADRRLARLFAPTYEALILSIRGARAVYGDETGWKIGGHNAWLWVFTEAEITIYAIDPTRAHEVIERILGADFQGVLGCDCFAAYDAVDYRQQKCTAHLLRTASELEADKTRGAVRFPRAVQRLLRAALRLKERQPSLSPHGFAVARGRLEKALDRLLAGTFTDPDNARFANRLRKHRHQLFVFLYEEGVAGTNNAAERAIRPAVIARKLSGGNRTAAGAQTHSILASILQTCRQKGEDFRVWMKTLLCSPQPRVAPWAQPVQPRSP
jgi:transposase